MVNLLDFLMGTVTLWWSVSTLEVEGEAIWQVMRTFCGDGVSRVSRCVASQPYLMIITRGRDSEEDR